MKFLKFALAGVVLFGTTEVLAAKADPDAYSCPRTPKYGQTDGVCVAKDGDAEALFVNGEGRPLPGSPVLTENFDYGDGEGAWCNSDRSLPGDTGYYVASSANQACDTTCGQAECVFGNNVGTGFVACETATADTCLCYRSGLDLRAVCGADWEAPALGVTTIELASGIKLGHVALLEQLIGPDMDADGLDIAGDQTDDDGVELFTGMYGASGRPFYPQEDPAFYFCATIKLTDLSGTDEFWIGFRDTTAPNATFNSYNSYAVIGTDTTTGDWHTETEDDGGGTTTTDVSLSALVEDTATTACVYVDGSGRATYKVNGVSPTDQVAYTFDAGEPVIPFIHFLHSSDLVDELLVSKWEQGFQ